MSNSGSVLKESAYYSAINMIPPPFENVQTMTCVEVLHTHTHIYSPAHVSAEVIPCMASQPVTLCCNIAWSLCKEHKQRLFEKKVLEKTFRTKSAGSDQFRTLHNDESRELD
jgi:hypothetical protein